MGSLEEIFCAEDESQGSTFSVENRFYLWDTIEFDTVLPLYAFLDEAEATGMDIELYVNSEGGSFWAGLAVADRIRRAKIRVTGIGDGLICSAAGDIFFACHTRKAGANAAFILHGCSVPSHPSLNQQTFRSAKKLLDLCDEKAFKLLADMSGKTIEFWQGLIKDDDVIFTTQELIELGLCDEVL